MTSDLGNKLSANDRFLLGKRLGLVLQQPDFTVSVPSRVKRLKVDVGLSHDAIHSLDWLKRDPSLFVIGFEPLLENVSRIQDRSSSLGSDISSRFLLVPCALGERRKTARIFVTEDTGLASFLSPKTYEVSEQREVLVERLDEIFQLIPPGRFKRVDHLKTDCQGTDLDVLRGSIGILGSVALVTSEAESRHYVNPDNREQDIDQLLSENGFSWINRPSNLKLKIRMAIDDSPKLFRFAISQLHKKIIASLISRNRGSKSSGSIDVVDPTWANQQFIEAIQSGEITARQWN